MSGQPYRYEKDIANFRTEYMNTLGLRANLDDMNLQANKTYKDTGSLPPMSQMKDNRLTSEILADTEKIKLSIMGDFKDLCTPNMAALVIQRVQGSPLNADGSFLSWLAQNAPELVLNIKKKYKFGIASNANDAEQMYLFLQTMFSKTKEMNSSIKSSFDRPVGGDKLGLVVGDLDAIKKQYQDIQYRLISKFTGRQQTRGLTPLMNDINRQFEAMSEVLKTTNYNDLSNIFLTTSQNANEGEQLRINELGYKDWLEYTDKVPSTSSLRTLLDQLEKSEKNVDPSLSHQILMNISSILPSYDDTMKIKQTVEYIIDNSGVPRPPTTSGGRRPSTDGPPPPPPPSSSSLSASAPPRTSAPPRIGAPPRSTDRYVGLPNPRGLSADEIDICEAMNLDWDQPEAIRLSVPDNVEIRRRATEKSVDATALIDKLSRGVGTTVSGLGLRRRGRPKGSGLVKPLHERIDHTKGIKQGATHIPFGKYILNKNKLDDDIFYFKHSKGSGIKGYPASRISKNLSRVIKTIVGGGVPAFDELNNLSQEEKLYLHKVSKKAGIMDKVSIPTPSKDQQEKDIHQFEVMKGEILAGNDSTETIKKFKLILLKLSRNGTIPKREANEVMEDLISLGY